MEPAPTRAAERHCHSAGEVAQRQPAAYSSISLATDIGLNFVSREINLFSTELIAGKQARLYGRLLKPVDGRRVVVRPLVDPR
jgi:hypothetical protein